MWETDILVVGQVVETVGALLSKDEGCLEGGDKDGEIVPVIGIGVVIQDIFKGYDIPIQYSI